MSTGPGPIIVKVKTTFAAFGPCVLEIVDRYVPNVKAVKLSVCSLIGELNTTRF